MVAPSHLKALQALELALRTGSFREAGAILAITPAAVGQRIKALEDYLGIELLERGRAGIKAHPELAAALPHLHQGFASLELAARELDLQRARELHIAATSDFADLWLLPRLSRFRELHPNVLFCINGQGDVPMRLGRVDCEIYFGPVSDDPFSDVLFRDYVVPITSQANLERLEHLPEQTRLEGFPLLHLDFYKNDPAGISWPNWILAAGTKRDAPERGMRFQRITAAVAAVQANAGITLCGLALVLEHLSDGSLALPYPISSGTWSDHAFVASFRAEATGRDPVSRFRDWLRSEGAQTARSLRHVAGSETVRMRLDVPYV